MLILHNRSGFVRFALVVVIIVAVAIMNLTKSSDSESDNSSGTVTKKIILKNQIPPHVREAWEEAGMFEKKPPLKFDARLSPSETKEFKLTGLLNIIHNDEFELEIDTKQTLGTYRQKLGLDVKIKDLKVTSFVSPLWEVQGKSRFHAPLVHGKHGRYNKYEFTGKVTKPFNFKNPEKKKRGKIYFNELVVDRITFVFDKKGDWTRKTSYYKGRDVVYTMRGKRKPPKDFLKFKKNIQNIFIQNTNRLLEMAKLSKEEVLKDREFQSRGIKDINKGKYRMYRVDYTLEVTFPKEREHVYKREAMVLIKELLFISKKRDYSFYYTIYNGISLGEIEFISQKKSNVIGVKLPKIALE